MNDEVRKFSWRNTVLLLAAFAAGALVTQLMPAYEPFVGKITYPTQSRSSAKADSDATHRLSATPARERQLALVRNLDR